MAAALVLALPLRGWAEGQPGAWKIPGTDTTLKVYGYVQLSTTVDFSGRPDPAVEWGGSAAQIPLNGSAAFRQKPQLYWSTAPTRVGFTTTTPSGIGEVGTRVEFDFKAGNGVPSSAANPNGIRMRHAYGTFGKYLLVGQTWSTFIDVAAYPDTVEFNPPMNNPLIRQPMVRGVVPLGPARLALSAENGASSVVGLGGAAKGAFESIPDFVASLTYPGSFGHVSARAVTMNYKNVNHARQGVAGALSGSLKFAGDTLVWEVQGGRGIGRYMFGALLGGQDATDNGDKILLWDGLGYHLGFTHVWCPQFRSNAIWSQLFMRGDPDVQNSAARAASKAAVTDSGGDIVTPATVVSPGSFNHRIDQVLVNTFWTLTKTSELGLEYTWARRTTFAGDIGTENRINIAAKYNFF